jgi:hypothetical protein
MDITDTNRISRSDDYGWQVIVSADNDVDLVQYVIPVGDLAEAAQKANAIVVLTIKYEQADYTQITLKAWRIEITMSTPGSAWRSESQMQLAATIPSLA